MQTNVNCQNLLIEAFKTFFIGSWPNFAANIKRIQTNWVLSVPPEIIRKPLVFRWFQEVKKLFNSLDIRSEIWWRSLRHCKITRENICKRVTLAFGWRRLWGCLGIFMVKFGQVNLLLDIVYWRYGAWFRMQPSNHFLAQSN